jgi:hypothetical protein
MKKPTPAQTLAGRLTRPQRVGLFGRRGAGKTTLLTMLYREAVGGRLPGLRLAAGDARTATYLADKVLQLEAGAPLPATLAETELRFNLYHEGCRLDLVVLDYQGEHVALGRQEPVREFLRDCDAVLICLDVPSAQEPAARLTAEQEVEQLVEDYLGKLAPEAPQRPMALVLTKSDLLTGDEAARVEEWAAERFHMTRHALASHCATREVLAVSSLGGPVGPLVPAGLDAPLAWLARALREQDEARLRRLWGLAPGELGLLERAVAGFLARYPGAPSGREFQSRLRAARARRNRRRAAGVAAGLLAAIVGLWTYDAIGAQQARSFATANDEDPVAVRQHWESYQRWHPTRHLLRPAARAAEKERLAELDARIREQERTARLAALRRAADDPDADLDAVHLAFRHFRADFPEFDADREWQGLQARFTARANAAREKKALAAFRDLERAEARGALPSLIDLATTFLGNYAGTAPEAEVARRRAAYLARLDTRDFEVARDYSRKNPLNFTTRRQRYRDYLDRHPRGAHASQAQTAMTTILAEWDRHDFRKVRDHYQAKPGAVRQLMTLCRTYLSAHPQGRYQSKAQELLRWAERVSEPGEYKVVLKSGEFSKKVAHMISRGAYLSVTLEVGGVRYGPSTIVARSYSPEWDYEFPRRIRWQAGDPVRIIVTDNYYWKRQVADLSSDDDDQLAMRLLAGEVEVSKGTLVFSSDFKMPAVPRVD